MAMTDLGSQFGVAGTGINDKLPEALNELQGLTTLVVDGAAANTNIAVGGLGATDHVQSVVQYAAGVPSVLTPSAQTAGNLQFASATTGNKLVVTFYKK